LIGGMLGLELGSAGQPAPFLKGGELLFVNARSALAWLVETLCPSRVWLPSYLCSAVARPLLDHGVATYFFPINDHLEPWPGPWLKQLQPRDLVVAIDYFGFPCPPWFPEQVRQSGAWFVSDASQALLSAGAGQLADFVLFSPRKFVGVPDGGVLRMNTKLSLRKLALDAAPAAWWLSALEAAVVRREFDAHGGPRRWFELFQQTEEAAPVGPYAMSELSRLLLTRAIDYAALARRRQENFRTLLEQFPELALYRVLPEEVVPLGFPIRLRDRDRVRDQLFAADIYPATHWPLDGLVPAQFEASHRLAREILTLPCDQRYDLADMDRIVQALRKAGAS
jgi:dTDP-4-amino-4,6-dideoxygalactose transaminase